MKLSLDFFFTDFLQHFETHIWWSLHSSFLLIAMGQEVTWNLLWRKIKIHIEQQPKYKTKSFQNLITKRLFRDISELWIVTWCETKLYIFWMNVLLNVCICALRKNSVYTFSYWGDNEIFTDRTIANFQMMPTKIKKKFAIVKVGILVEEVLQ